MIYKLPYLQHPSCVVLEIVMNEETGRWMTPGPQEHLTRSKAIKAMEKLAVRNGYKNMKKVGV